MNCLHSKNEYENSLFSVFKLIQCFVSDKGVHKSISNGYKGMYLIRELIYNILTKARIGRKLNLCQ